MQDINTDSWTEASEPEIAYVYGEAPPDFAAIAASGFDIVVMDNTAAWYNANTIAEARSHGLKAFAFRMSYPGLRPTTYR
ncbi:MAG TPA: hypothetical protein VL383_16185 [Gemmatimonadaceae bacterium]|jgi:hypothetical protein|nr:hypothetical protein [Gemmatimonadaceae bacterium]